MAPPRIPITPGGLMVIGKYDDVGSKKCGSFNEIEKSLNLN